MMWVIPAISLVKAPAVNALGGDRMRQKPGKVAEAFFCVADNPQKNKLSFSD